MREAQCPKCKTDYPIKEFFEHVEKSELYKCPKSTCPGIIKPKVVFYGENLPESFYGFMEKVKEADLCIIIGTALAVNPFSTLPQLINKDCHTLILNMEPIKGFKESPKLLNILGPCDDAVKKICKSLDWDKDLDDLIAKL